MRRVVSQGNQQRATYSRARMRPGQSRTRPFSDAAPPPQNDAAREKEDFEAAFAKWSKGMRKHTLNRKLNSDWIPQMDPSTGGTYYFNLKTAETTHENPNARVARATEKRQRAKGEANLSERLKRLEVYAHGLEEKHADEMRAFEVAVAREMIETTLGWRRACCFPTYYRANRASVAGGSSRTSTRAASAAASVAPTPPGPVRDVLRMERGESTSSTRSARSSIPSAEATPRGSRAPTPPDQPRSSRPQTPRGPSEAASSAREVRVSSARRRLPAASVPPRAPYVLS